MIIKSGEILSKIESPADLKKLNGDQLKEVCKELRQYIIDIISQNPGHLGASLGVVELTVALHYVMNTPDDKLIWDVGHQAYGHKILTGRRDAFRNNRKYKGISGFPKMAESEYDAFGVGHSSTSISAALGMAIASKLQGNTERQHVAVIGDGSMTGGMALEALNNAGVSDSNVLIILNDNGISIDKSSTALKNYLTSITTSKTYNRLKDYAWKILGKRGEEVSESQRLISQIENAIKGSILEKSNFFESLNIRYFGPVDGHNINKLVKVLKDLKTIRGPKLLHIITTKGKGLKPAEINQTKYHAPGLFNPKTGELIKKDLGILPPKYQDVFGETIIELARLNDKIVGITPAMPSGCSLNKMMEVMPERTFDVGIAEQHAVTFAAGLASSGMTPFCNIYSSFMQRAYDQVIHDIAIQKLPVVLCMDRGGIVGEDGATHHGVFDMSMFRSIPNLILSAPMNEVELRNLMYTAQLENNSPFCIRYPRGRGVTKDWEKPFNILPIGKGEKLSEGKEIALVTIGHPGNFAQEAIWMLKEKNIFPSHYNMRFLKPIDESLLHDACKSHKTIITIEDGTVIGGLGSSVIEFVNKFKYEVNVMPLGVPDRFIEQGSVDELMQECNFDTNSIVETIESLSQTNLQIPQKKAI
ncbi:MAG: 1-deoxy-D-xylulose-5-phosphate synthase [Hyphomicrobiales bacterium]